MRKVQRPQPVGQRTVSNKLSPSPGTGISVAGDRYVMLKRLQKSLEASSLFLGQPAWTLLNLEQNCLEEQVGTYWPFLPFISSNHSDLLKIKSGWCDGLWKASQTLGAQRCSGHQESLCIPSVVRSIFRVVLRVSHIMEIEPIPK